MKKQRLIIILSIYVLPIFTIMADSLHVNGRWIWERIGKNGNTNTVANMPFSIDLKDDVYWIELEHNAPPSAMHVRLYSDGLDNYESSMSISSLKAVEKLQNEAKIIPNNYVAIRSGIVPNSEFTAAQLLWLSVNLNKSAILGDDKAVVFRCFEGDDLFDLSQLRIKRNKNSSGKLESIEYFAPGKGFDKRRSYEYSLADNYREGYLIGKLVVLQYVNESSSVPQRFDFEYYNPKQNPENSSDVALSQAWRFTVEMMGQAPDGVLKMPVAVTTNEHIYVNDYRIAKKDGSSYGYEMRPGQAWLSRESEQFKQYQGEVQNQKEVQSKARSYFTFIFLLPTIALTVLLIRAQRRDKQKGVK